MEHEEAALLPLQLLEGQLPLKGVGKQLELVPCSRLILDIVLRNIVDSTAQGPVCSETLTLNQCGLA